jgi:hypothetical protein
MVVLTDIVGIARLLGVSLAADLALGGEGLGALGSSTIACRVARQAVK